MNTQSCKRSGKFDKKKTTYNSVTGPDDVPQVIPYHIGEHALLEFDTFQGGVAAWREGHAFAKSTKAACSCADCAFISANNKPASIVNNPRKLHDDMIKPGKRIFCTQKFAY